MSLFGKLVRGGALVGALTAGLALSGCGAGGVDLDIDAPVLSAVGLNLSSKPKNEEDLPERSGLVMPPSTASALPAPGERAANVGQNWPADVDETKKQKADAEAAAKEKYCREGDWSNKAGITEFEKNTGRQARCPSKVGEAIAKSMGGGEVTAKAK